MILVMRRKQYIDWLATVFGIFGTVYGAYLLVWHYRRGNGILPVAMILFVAGVISLVFAIALLTSRYIAYKKRKDHKTPAQEEIEIEIEEDKIEAPQQKPIEEFQEETTQEEPKRPYKRNSDYIERSSSSTYSYSTVYIKLVGHGPILRIEESRILDMRDNSYYRIEGNNVNKEGYGLCFEIRGNQIREAFGGYLFEISGSNINKIYGGFYASISGNYITIHDLSRKYEMTDSLSTKQLLVVSALLFK